MLSHKAKNYLRFLQFIAQNNVATVRLKDLGKVAKRHEMSIVELSGIVNDLRRFGYVEVSHHNGGTSYKILKEV